MVQHDPLMLGQPSRRAVLRRATVAGVSASLGSWSGLVLAASFESRSLAQVAKALGAKSLAASADVRLNTLDYAENGAAVPVDIGTALPGVERIALWVEKNPTPLIAVFQPGESIDTALTMHIKMAQTSAVFGLVILSDGRALFAKKDVKVVLGSCGAVSDTPDPVVAKRTTEPTRIRAAMLGESAMVRMRMAHEMESGQRKNAAGKLVPAWHIDQVAVRLNGQSVLKADWGPGVARNPYLQLTLKKVRVGDRLSVSWRDNLGASRDDEILLG